MADHADLARKPAPQSASAADAAGFGAAPAVAQLAETGRTLNGGPAVTAQRKLEQALSRPQPRHAPVREPVVQARLYRGQDEIEAPERQADASPIVHSLIQSPTEYVLRATSHLTDPVVHTLRRDQKYLLGERHDQSNWPQRSAGWGIDTMIEAGKAIPEQPRVHPLGTRTDQPLESSHAFTVAAVLQWRTSFSSWHESWGQWKRARNGEVDDIDDEALEREFAALQAEHGSDDVDEKKSGHDDDRHGLLDPHEDVELGHGLHGEDNAGLLELYSTANTKDLAQVSYDQLVHWAGQMQMMIAQQLHFITSNVGVPNTAAYRLMARDLPAIPARIDSLMQRIRLVQTVSSAHDADRERLFDKGFADADAIMAKLTLMFAAASPDVSAESRTDLVARARGAAPLGPGTGLALTHPAREAAMIRNVNAARAPLLVKIGNEHVERVTAGVHGGVAVPIGKDFDQMTRQPGGEERNPLGYLGMALGAGLLVGGAIAGATLLGGGLALGGLIAGGLGFFNRNRNTPGELA